MKIGFIGAGNMGSALIAAATKAAIGEIYIYDTDTNKALSVAAAYGARVAEREYIAANCGFVILGVKPNIIPTVMESISSIVNDETVIVSMAAGVKTEKIEKIAVCFFGS